MQSIPAAWYPDPSDPTRVRWWDGDAWTQSTQPSELSAQIYEPMSEAAFTRTSAEGETVVVVESATTWALWAITLFPVAHFAVIWIALYLAKLSMPTIGRYALFIVPLVVYPLFAVADRNTLIFRGNARPPAVAWSLLPPIYLVIRSVRIPRASLIPAIIWIVLEVSAIVFLVSQSSDFVGSLLGPPSTAAPVAGMTPPFTAAQRAYLLTPAGMAKKITYDYAHPGPGVPGLPVTDAKCAPLASKQPTAQTTCTVNLAGQKLELVIIVLEDAAATPFYVANQGLAPN